MPPIINAQFSVPKLSRSLVPTAKQSVVVIGSKDVEGMRNKVVDVNSNNEIQHVHEKALHLHELSKARASNWDNTVSGSRKKKEMEVKLRKQKEELERQRLDAEEARYKNYIEAFIYI